MMKNRRRGALIGLAVGDALGQPVEFMQPGSFRPVTGYRAGGPHHLNAGDWTDDTSMALALADSLKHGWDLNDQARRYTQWLEEGKYSVNGWCFDIGSTTRHALENFMETNDATRSGLREAESSGNGGIMRIAPVAIRYCQENVPTLLRYGSESSSVTHASRMCQSAAAYMTAALAALMNGKSREEALSYYTEDMHPAVIDIATGSYKNKTPKGSGFVIESLGAALWAFYDAKDFREAVLKAVNLGDDADTTGAVCGQFAGAYWGESDIPLEWRQNLSKMEMIEDALLIA